MTEVRLGNINQRVINWSFINAGFIALGTGLAIISDNLWILATAAALSFLLFIIRANSAWTPGRSFGIGNLITLARLLIILWMLVCYFRFNNLLIITLSILVLIGDGIDGLIAQRRKENSLFGEYFDKETDALYLHSLIMIAIFKDILPVWIVITGLFRYLFLFYLLIIRKTDRKERRSNTGRYIYVFACIAFILPFIPQPLIYLPAVILATVLLVYSFSRDIIWIHFGK